MTTTMLEPVIYEEAALMISNDEIRACCPALARSGSEYLNCDIRAQVLHSTKFRAVYRPELAGPFWWKSPNYSLEDQEARTSALLFMAEFCQEDWVGEL